MWKIEREQMRIAIVDDEEIWRTKTEQEVMAYNFVCEVEVEKYASGENFLKNSKNYDIVFLDVEMNRIDGFQTAAEYRKIYPDAIIIILTTHTELSRKGYMVNAFRYIDKANMNEEMAEALMSAELLLNRNQTIELDVSGLGNVAVVMKDILYIETVSQRVNVHTEEREYASYMSMADLEEKLKDFGFFRCHKSYIVNLDKIREFTRTEIQMKDGSTVYVSVRRYPELKRQFLDHKFKYANS